jgi:hypothetical protein
VLSISYLTRNERGLGSRKPFKFRARSWNPIFSIAVEEVMERLEGDKNRVA